MEVRGLGCAIGAAVAYGVQYTPVKKYEIFDGTTFQWFMGSGILSVGFVVALSTGDLEGGCPLPIVLGGALWGLSNCCVLPLVKLLGIGLGFSLYHFVNLIVGYLVGRLGLFGIHPMTGTLEYCDLGCGLILASFIVMVFVETADGEDAVELRRPGDSLTRCAGAAAPQEGQQPVLLEAPDLESSHIAEYRATYRQWRLTGMDVARQGPRRRASLEYRSIGGFGVQGEIPLLISPTSSLIGRDFLLVAENAAVASARREAVEASAGSTGEGLAPEAAAPPEEPRGTPGPGSFVSRGPATPAQSPFASPLALPSRGPSSSALTPFASPLLLPSTAPVALPSRGSADESLDELCISSSLKSRDPSVVDCRTEPLVRRLSGTTVPSAGGGAALEASRGREGPRPQREQSAWGKKLTGVALALVGGSLCGVQAVPATKYMNEHPGASPTAVVFPQCLGIWAATSAVYVVFSFAAKAGGRRVPHSAIRPAFLSGCIWAIGFLLMIFGMDDLGYSVGYSLDAAGPIMVSSLLSLIVFREITGKVQIKLYVCAFAAQLIGVVLIAAFGKQGT